MSLLNTPQAHLQALQQPLNRRPHPNLKLSTAATPQKAFHPDPHILVPRRAKRLPIKQDNHLARTAKLPPDILPELPYARGHDLGARPHARAAEQRLVDSQRPHARQLRRGRHGQRGDEVAPRAQGVELGREVQDVARGAEPDHGREVRQVEAERVVLLRVAPRFLVGLQIRGNSCGRGAAPR